MKLHNFCFIVTIHSWLINIFNAHGRMAILVTLWFKLKICMDDDVYWLLLFFCLTNLNCWLLKHFNCSGKMSLLTNSVSYCLLHCFLLKTRWTEFQRNLWEVIGKLWLALRGTSQNISFLLTLGSNVLEYKSDEFCTSFTGVFKFWLIVVVIAVWLYI